MKFGPDDNGVSPVVGTVLVLAITVLGLGVVLAWGVPAIQVVQDQTALASMEAEFSNLRLEAQGLRIVEDSRAAAIDIPSGSVYLENGTTFYVHAVYKDTPAQSGNNGLHLGWYKDCRVWAETWVPGQDLIINHPECKALYKVSGNGKEKDDEDYAQQQGTSLEFTILVQEISSGIPVTKASEIIAFDKDKTVIQPEEDLNFNEGQWQVIMMDDKGGQKFAVWIVNSQRLVWDIDSQNGANRMVYENGGIFSESQGTIFALAQPEIREDDGLGHYGVRLAALKGDSLQHEGPDTMQMYLQLAGSDVRANNAETLRLRYDFQGEMAQSWCNMLLARNPDITAGQYVEVADAPCDTGDADGRYAVNYEPTETNELFTFGFVHSTVAVQTA